jgi:hypothetical protein
MRWYAAVLAIVFQCSLNAGPKWLAVIATSPSLERTIAEARQLHASSGVVQIVASDDCANLKPALFLIVAGVFDDQEAAQRTVAGIHKSIPDAYVRACEPKSGSRVQFRINAVDASIFDVLSSTVNWADEDRLSEVRAAGPVYLWIRRQYDKEKNDPREGRRTSVLLFKTDPASALRLSNDCTDPQVVATARLVALACARETAGDHLFHQVQIFDSGSGRVIRTVDRCRNPKLIGDAELTCEAEAVDADGVLKLSLKRMTVRP